MWQKAGFNGVILFLAILLALPAFAADMNLSKEVGNFRQSKGLRPFTSDPRLTLAARNIMNQLAKKGPNGIPSNFLTPALKRENYIWSAAQAYVSFLPKGYDRPLEDFLKQANAKKALLNKDRWVIGAAATRQLRHSSYANTAYIQVLILAKPSLSADDNWQQETLRFVNKFRSENRLPPLTLNRRLSKAAQHHADDMFVRDFFDHISPSGTNPGQRASRFGYNWQLILENLATGQPTPFEVVEGWKNSKTGHREAMLNPEVTEAGIGYKFMASDKGRYNSHHYWAMSMGLPK